MCRFAVRSASHTCNKQAKYMVDAAHGHFSGGAALRSASCWLIGDVWHKVREVLRSSLRLDAGRNSFFQSRCH